MTDFVLPSQDDMRAVDLSTLVINEADEGLLTPWFGALVKNFVDQMMENEVLHIRAPNSSTGKTEKFILQNVASMDNCPTIVTTDFFTNMVMNTQDFMTLIDNSDRVYRNFLNPYRPADGEPADSPIVSADVNKNLKNYPDGDKVTIDLSVDPAALSDAEILALSLDADMNPAIVLNANGEALGAAEDDFAPQFAISFGMDTGKGLPSWAIRRKLLDIASMYNNLPVNGALLVLNYTLSSAQTAVQRFTGVLDAAGKTYSMVTYSPAEGQPASAVAIKKLSA